MLQNGHSSRNIKPFRRRWRSKRSKSPGKANGRGEEREFTDRASSGISANILDFVLSAKAETGLKDRHSEGQA
jgi:hypothetical protein